MRLPPTRRRLLQGGIARVAWPFGSHAALAQTEATPQRGAAKVISLAPQPQPEVAQSWTFAPDGLALTLNLRRGVKWHDGRDFKSSHVAASLQSVWQKSSGAGGWPMPRSLADVWLSPK